MPDRKLNIVLLPFAIDWTDKNANLTRTVEFFNRLKPGTDLVILPETFSTGFPTPNAQGSETPEHLAETDDGKTMSMLRQLAHRSNTAVAGSFIAGNNGALTNRAFFIEPTGEVYFADKRHLFSMAGEDKTFTPGRSRLRVRYRGWNIAMAVCYDLRFPVWCRNRRNEYDLLVVVANWPASRAAAWRKLLEARAIENLAYVAGVDCLGTDLHGTLYNGSSAVIDWLGNPVAEQQDSDRPLYATLSLDRLEAFRSKFPAHLDADNFKLC